MPMHDWTRVTAGTYHNFHLRWIASIMDRLNAGLLPPGFFAMAEQTIGRPEPDVVTFQTGPKRPRDFNGSVAVAAKPKTRFVLPLEEKRYAKKANRVAVHHGLGNVVAVVELVSPGNKGSEYAMRTFAQKAADLVGEGVNLLVIDPFPPGPRDPQGVHKLIWDQLGDLPFELPADKRLTCAAYQTEPTPTAYVEPFAVGDPVPAMPLFLVDEYHIDLPLEETYAATWAVLPAELRALLEPPGDGG
ncbi:MAG: DUF4058 family protein [Gemmataceae bacterium]